MLAASGRPFLIECNANPLIAGQNPWHEQLVSRMVDDYVTLAADEAFFASDAARAPLPRPPLDGSHVQEWGDHSGFELIVGRPTEAHTQPLYGVATADNNMLVLQRANQAIFADQKKILQTIKDIKKAAREASKPVEKVATPARAGGPPQEAAPAATADEPAVAA